MLMSPFCVGVICPSRVPPTVSQKTSTSPSLGSQLDPVRVAADPENPEEGTTDNDGDAA